MEPPAADGINAFFATGLVLAVAFIGVVLGFEFRRRLPSEHLNGPAIDFVKIAAGLVTTMVALLLSLQLSSGKAYFDAQQDRITLLGVQIRLLDGALAVSGPAAGPARLTLQLLVTRILERTWPDNQPPAGRPQQPAGSEILYQQIVAIPVTNATQSEARGEALQLVYNVAQTVEETSLESKSPTALPLLAVEIAWIGLVFATYGIIAPRNEATIAIMTLCALAVAGAIFLIAEMSSPFSGLIRISDAPLRDVLQHISRTPLP